MASTRADSDPDPSSIRATPAVAWGGTPCTSRAVPVPTAAAPGQQAFDALDQVRLRPGPQLHQGHPGGGVGGEHVHQPVSLPLTERRHCAGQVDHLATRGGHPDELSLHVRILPPATHGRSTLSEAMELAPTAGDG